MATQLSFDNPEMALDLRIEEVLAGKSGPWPLDSDTSTLLRMLQRHKGSGQPLPIQRISEHLGLSPRLVKASVKSLVEDFRLPIGGSRQEPYGYFLILTPEDLELALRPLVHEMQSIGRRIRALGGEQRMAELFYQTRLQLEKEA